VSSVASDTLAQAGRREERKAQNRAKLMAAARKVFAEKGLGEATARDIVRETDLATGTFYNYFRDKEDVFRALLEEFEHKVGEAALPLQRDESLPLDQRIERGAAAYFRAVVEDAQLFAVLRRNSGALAMMSTRDFFGGNMPQFEDGLRQWRTEGSLPGIDLDYLSAAISGAAWEISIRLVERDPMDPDEAARFLTRMILGMIQALASPSET
jgi:AcrR family transcriptional regulator